jgi:hypothetical protein
MLRSIMLSLALALTALLTFAAPHEAAALDGRYVPAPQYQPGPTAQDLAGTWFMSGDADQPCYIKPSRTAPDRATFINENGDQTDGYIRGNRVIVPKWHLSGRFDGDTIRWEDRSVWTR